MEDRTGVLGRAASTYTSWPLWGRIAAPVAAAFVGIAALGGAAEEEPIEVDALADISGSTTTTTAAEEVDVATLISQVPTGFGTADIEAIVSTACSELRSTDTASAAAGTFEVIDASVDGLTGEQVDDVILVLEDVAPDACPEAVAAHPNFLRELTSLAPVLATTTTTTNPVPPTTLPPTTVPATTMPPTTVAPATTAPPTTVAPPPPTTAPPAASPTVSYSNCSEAKAAGAAPVHRGDPGYGSHLDRDDDGVGCET